MTPKLIRATRFAAVLGAAVLSTIAAACDQSAGPPGATSGAGGSAGVGGGGGAQGGSRFVPGSNGHYSVNNAFPGGGAAGIGTGGIGGAIAGAGPSGPVCTLSVPSGAPSVPPSCGDGYRIAAEECDDGNTASGDACDSACHITP